MADLRISQLQPLLAADVDGATDQLPIADVSTTETKKITPAALVQAAVGSLPAGSIPGGKIVADSITALQLGPDSVGASELADNAVDTAAVQDLAITTAKIAADAITAAQIAPDAIGASELADNAVDTAAIAAGAVTATKIASDTITAAQIAPNAIGASELADGAVDTAAIADGAVTTPKLADGAVTGVKIAAGTIAGDRLAAGAVGTTGLADGGVTAAKMAGDLSGAAFAAQAPAVVLAGPVAGVSAKPSFRGLVGTDLPLATGTDVGVSKPVANGGLVIAAGGLSIDNTVAPGTNPVVSYNAKGLVTGGRALAGTDLPIATTTAVGVVRVGSGLSVAANGEVKVALAATDIPNLDAAKITTGTFGAALIANHAITREKLADNVVSYIQEASPPTTGQNVGCLWLQESTGQLRMWNGNSWFPVGFGRLSAENLRYCGVFNAATGAVTGVTQFGTQEGFKIGDIIPSASDAKSGVYFVCGTPGNGAAVATGIAFDAGDWIICNGATAGWTRIDTLNGAAGGGGGATHLHDLLDVQLTAPVAGQSLEFNTSGQWVNKTPVDASTTGKGVVQLATQAEVNAGTDALKAVTAATLKQYVSDKAPDATTSAKGIVQLATQTEVTAGTDAVKAVTPATLKQYVSDKAPDASATVKGIIELATQAEVDTGTNALKSITPLTLQNCTLLGGTY